MTTDTPEQPEREVTLLDAAQRVLSQRTHGGWLNGPDIIGALDALAVAVVVEKSRTRHPAASVPDTHVVVPREPTEAMFRAYAEAGEGPLSDYWFERQWSAALSAAPLPPTDDAKDAEISRLREALGAMLSRWELYTHGLGGGGHHDNALMELARAALAPREQGE